MADVSKNQRSGPKQKPRERYCPEGHVIVPVKYVPIAGHGKMMDSCACGVRPRPRFQR